MNNNKAKELGRKKDLSIHISWLFHFMAFVCGAGSFAVGTWILVDRNFYSAMFGTTLMEVSAYLLAVGGGLACIFSFIGCGGGCCKSRCVILIHCIAIALSSLVLIIGGIVAIIYKVKIDQTPDSVKVYMRDNLQRDYGVDLDNGYNQKITASWDNTQTRLGCCSVEDQSWLLYQSSEWFKMQPADPVHGKPLVPPSCCVRRSNGDYSDLVTCQTFKNGPPSDVNGDKNPFLFYRGCYGAIQEFSSRHANYLIGVGIGMGLLLIPDICASIWVIAVVLRVTSDRVVADDSDGSAADHYSLDNRRPDYRVQEQARSTTSYPYNNPYNNNHYNRNYAKKKKVPTATLR